MSKKKVKEMKKQMDKALKNYYECKHQIFTASNNLEAASCALDAFRGDLILVEECINELSDSDVDCDKKKKSKKSKKKVCRENYHIYIGPNDEGTVLREEGDYDGISYTVNIFKAGEGNRGAQMWACCIEISNIVAAVSAYTKVDFEENIFDFVYETLLEGLFADEAEYDDVELKIDFDAVV